ncbi:hypothetical protein Tco_0073413 [Tanacetum coccineum]
MSADSTVTYTSVHSEARSWKYVPDPIELEDHVPVYILEPEHPKDLVPAEDEAPTPPLPPLFLSLRIRPLHTRAAIAQMRATAPSTYHSLLPSGTPPLLPIPLPAPSTSCRADILEADTPPRKRLLLTTPRPSYEVGQSSAAAAARQPGPTIAHRVDHSRVDTMETRALEARVTVLETEVRRHEWQRQAADDLVVQHIMRTQALEAGARVDTLEDTATTTTVTEAQLQALIDQGVAATMAEAKASRVRNGYNSNGSGPGPAQVVRECLIRGSIYI